MAGAGLALACRGYGLVRGFRRCPGVYGDDVVLLGFPCKHTIEREIWRRGGASSMHREGLERKRENRRQHPPLPSIYPSSDELRPGICVGFEVQ
jgi:hypothetical protein